MQHLQHLQPLPSLLDRAAQPQLWEVVAVPVCLGGCGPGLTRLSTFFSNNIGASIITYTILGVPYYNYTATALVKKQLIFPEGGLDFLFLKHCLFLVKNVFRDLRITWIS